MIPEGAVDAAAKALFEASPVSRGAKVWDQMDGSSVYKRAFRQDALEALEAAMPFIKEPS